LPRELAAPDQMEVSMLIGFDWIKYTKKKTKQITHQKNEIKKTTSNNLI
jgi:hypothetical protein